MSANDTSAQPPSNAPEGIIQSFIYTTNAVYGAYLDATMAIGNLARGYMDYHKSHIERVRASGQPLTPEALNPVVIYNAGPEGEQRPVHQTTLVDIIERNSLHGRHIQLLAKMCVVTLYQYWEDGFRPLLGKAMGHEVKHDTFGELRNLRRSILHRGGRAMPELSSCKALPRFDEGEEIVLDHQAMDQIIVAVKQAAADLVQGGAA